ncbi:hypothetical protein QWY31_15625 [Cytophagales bacterium LB-30]|uniref:Peptidase C-terminal archaeal/bacterial domain-containing protein n=1 Tax=Shiella aurantiaca TaxID=3058365 RepID=A0ABT8FAE1_9BACT|nr:hypothetical protein [Shiella aurantiaca]MDN4166941.1 hypothetical protein [Shiella aurantiaca]
MKKVIAALSLFILLGVASPQVFAQCDTEKYTEACIPKLPEGFTYLKSYKVDGDGGAKQKVEYSYVFTKGAQYMINVCTEGNGADGIVVTLYDSNRNKVASSLFNGQFLTALTYPCNTTGIYYITYTFEGSKANCGGSVLGFKR